MCMGCNWEEDCTRTRPSWLYSWLQFLCSFQQLSSGGSGNRSPREIPISSPLVWGLSVHCKLSEQNMSSVESSRVISSAQECFQNQGQQCFQSTHVPGALITTCILGPFAFTCSSREPVETELQPSADSSARLVGSLGKVIETVCMLPAVKQKFMLQTLLSSHFLPGQGPQSS